jgi:hypothetical protein
MISAIIFSKDRAQQLRLLLESMWFNAYRLFDDVHIIWKATSVDFNKGYAILKEETILPIGTNWISESNLYNDTLKAINGSPKGFTTFFTDDSIFYRNVQSEKFTIESCLHSGSEIGCFSLRMGVNTTEQCYWQPGNCIRLNYSQVGKLIKWRHGDYPITHGYGYPLSLDGHVFRSIQMKNFVTQLRSINGVNSLEGSLGRYRNEIGPYMASFEQSALVTVPINRVQNECDNVSGLYHGITAKQLNDKYLDGYVVDYDSIDFSSINGTHQELAYKFRKR